VVHPVTGKVLGADTEELGTLVVSSVQDDFSIATLWPGKGGKPIAAMDKVITK